MDQALAPDIFARHAARPIPRYTSYPTAPRFAAGGVTEGGYRAWLADLPPDEPLSLYLHIPFCRAMCWYCGCHTTVTRREEPVQRYLGALRREVEMVADALPGRMSIAHLHFGGGTPTLMPPEAMTALMALLRRRFDFAPQAEVAIEIDPRTLEPAMARALGAAGFNRASIGVQSFDPSVQRAINRVQSFEVTRAAVEALRAEGVRAINFDLIYGLPHQDVASCLATVEQALALAPDRLAVFGYAHVPSFKLHQRKIDEAALPGAEERLAHSEAIAAALVAAGYVQIGLDHFARPGDSLARAAAEGRLHRNFQGYTTDACAALIGLGASSIGRLPGGFVQNIVSIGDYQRRLEEGALPVGRGCPVSAEDRLRAAIIERIMCDYRVDLKQVCGTFGVSPDALGAQERLAPLRADGLIEQEGEHVVSVAASARPLVRAVAAAFDAYLDETAGRHARAV